MILYQVWGPGDHSLGFCCSRSAASAHCHTLSLDMVVEIAWGENHDWCGDQNHHRAREVGNDPVCGQKREDSVITCGLHSFA